MKKLLIGILVLALLWCGYWLIGSRMFQNRVEDWFAAREAEGWQAEYSDFGVNGFPNRFDALWKDLRLADPDSGIAVSMPEFALFSLSYKPHHQIAIFPQEILVTTPVSRIPIINEDMRASLKVHPGRALELQSATLTASDLATEGDYPSSIGTLSLGMDQEEQSATTYRLGLLAQDVAPPSVLMNRFTQDAALPDTMQELLIDATVDFTEPWDMTAINDARPQPTHITLTTAKAQWGELSLQANADLSVNDQGIPTGDVNLQAKNWRQMIQAAVDVGALNETLARTLTRTLGLMAGLNGNSQSLSVTLKFENGRTYLGPVPIGPAPVLQLR